jgi:hypothetical protein
MLLVSNNNIGRASSWTGGAAAAFVAGSLTVLLAGATDQLRGLLAEPAIVGLGLAVASVLGGGLASRVVRSQLATAMTIAIGYGLFVPLLVAALIALPVAPIAAGFATIAWPVTVPAALGWLALIRWDRSRERLAAIPSASAATILATFMLVLRFTQPAATVSASGGQCLTFPGERIAALALSPDGRWLGVGSARDGEGIVRVIEQDSGKIIELARGPHVDTGLPGVAVGPDGATTYLVNVQDAAIGPEDRPATLWLASPMEAARPFAALPTPGVSDLTWTPDGIAAVQWVDPVTWTETHRLVLVRPNRPGATALEPMTPERILDHPVLAPLVNQSPGREIRVRTPSGDRTIDLPSDASGDISMTTDGAFLVFHARALSDDALEEKYSDVVAQSTEHGRRVVLVPGAGWSPKVAAGRVAYLTIPANPNNSVCVKAVAVR